MQWMGKSAWMVHVIVLVAMSVPILTYGRYVEWVEVCCEKGGSSVDMVKADVFKSSRMYNIDVQVPGINDLNIEIKKKKREVWVGGEHVKPDVTEDDETDEENIDKKWFIVGERGYGQFWRRFLFPINALMDRVEFRLQDGVLHIQAPLTAS